MARKQPFKAEPVTKPVRVRPKALQARSSGPALKDRRERSEAPTIPPPRGAKGERISQRLEATQATEDGRVSGMRETRKPAPPLISAATVDEVVADLTNDPRHERDDYDE